MASRSSKVQAHLERFGKQVRRLRVEKEMSQEALAHRAGLHRTYIGSVERGERNLALGNCYALSDALGVALADLVGGS